MNNQKNISRLKQIITILKDSDLASGMTPQKLYKTLEKLGPTFIKIGQILSTRVDLLPREYCDALAQLRSKVDPMSFQEIQTILKQQYKNVNKVFSHINKKSIGSASIAQVHKAKLVNGKSVVIKIRRPHVEETIDMDVKLMKKAILVLHLNKIIKVMDLNEVIDQMYQTAKEEINFNTEAEHLKKFKLNNKNISYVDCPKVYQNLTTKEVLVMEYIDGIKINEIEKLKANDYNCLKIGEKLSNNYINQAINDGFFHADPHPDNILIKNNQIIFIDLGMMGTLSTKNKALLKQCMKSMVLNNSSEVSRILVQMSTPYGEVDYEKIKMDISSILEEFCSTDLEKIDTKSFLSNMINMLKNNNLRLDKDVTMLIRGIGVIEGVLETLNPKLNLIGVFTQKEEQEVTNLFSRSAIKNMEKNIIKSSKSLAQIPNELLTFINELNNGENKFKLELTDSNKTVDKFEKLLHELIIGILDASLILASSIVDNIIIRRVFLFFIIVLSIWLLIKMYIDHKHNGY